MYNVPARPGPGGMPLALPLTEVLCLARREGALRVVGCRRCENCTCRDRVRASKTTHATRSNVPEFACNLKAWWLSGRIAVTDFTTMEAGALHARVAEMAFRKRFDARNDARHLVPGRRGCCGQATDQRPACDASRIWSKNSCGVSPYSCIEVSRRYRPRSWLKA